MGVGPAMGRGFTAEEETRTRRRDRPQPRRVAAPVGGDARVPIGSTVTINGGQSTIVGVMPPGFAFPSTAELWFPFAVDQAAGPRRALSRRDGTDQAGVTHERAESG